MSFLIPQRTLIICFSSFLHGFCFLSWFLLFVNVSPIFRVWDFMSFDLSYLLIFNKEILKSWKTAVYMTSIWNTHSIIWKPMTSTNLSGILLGCSYIKGRDIGSPVRHRPGHRCLGSWGRMETLAVTYCQHMLPFLTACGFFHFRIYQVLQICLQATTKVREC